MGDHVSITRRAWLGRLCVSVGFSDRPNLAGTKGPMGRNRLTRATHLHGPARPARAGERAFNLSNELNQTAREILAPRHALQDNSYGSEGCRDGRGAPGAHSSPSHHNAGCCRFSFGWGRSGSVAKGQVQWQRVKFCDKALKGQGLWQRVKFCGGGSSSVMKP